MALEGQGCNCRLPVGAWVFVHPGQYRDVMHALNGQHLRSSHVIAATSLEYLVAESLSNIGEGAWVRARHEVPWSTRSSSTAASPGSPAPRSAPGFVAATVDMDDLWQGFGVRRTFFCEVTPLRSAATVVQSTTEAHGGVNPRRGM